MSTASSPTAAPNEGFKEAYKLSFPRKLAYGSASFVDSWAVWVPMSLAAPVLTIQYGIAPWIVSFLFMAFRFWDAITDPIMGWISDNTKSRWGRRRPYLFVGAIMVAISFPMMWFFPRDASQTFIIGWMLVTGLLLYSSLTVWAMPYHSMYMELTADYNERTRINTFRFVCGIIFGLVIGWCWYITKLDIFVDPITGEPDTLMGTRYLTVVLGFIILCFGVLPAIFVKERFADTKLVKEHKKTKLVEDVKTSLRNRNFILLIFVTVFFVASQSLVNSFGQFINTYYVMEGDEALASKFSGFYQTISTVGVLFGLAGANWLSTRIGKRQTMAIALGIQAFGSLLTFFTLWPGRPYLTLINPFFLGFGMQAAWLLVGSMVADVADEDELQTGNRREGSFSSVYSWAVKFSFTLGFGLSGPLLEMTGFDVALGVDQADAFFFMKLVMTVLPTLTLLLAIWILRRFTITEAVANETRTELEARRGVI
jgi:glycoside/pentoside/hexuronide:cation symporter, GPH family